MFYGKQISELEVKVSALAHKVADLTKKVQEQDKEIESLKETVNQLSLSTVVVQFGVEEDTLIGLSKEQTAIITKMRDNYEKRLRRFVRSVTNKKSRGNGKEDTIITRDKAQM